MIEQEPSSVIAPRQALPAAFLHDLRTPLNHIIGYSEMLTEQAQEEGQIGFVPDLRSIHTAAKQLLALLNDGLPPVNSVSGFDANGNATSVSDDMPSLPTANSADINVRSFPDPEASVPDPGTGASVDPSLLGTAPASLLVVDDNAVNRDVLSRRLERQGYTVSMAENGHQAMDAMRARAFDLVLLDIMMPEMDGYEVLRRLKADEALCHIPVIMISAVDELDSVVRCIQMGADDYLPKPFDPTLLKARIGACLEKKSARDRETRLFTQLQQNYKRLQALEQQRDDLTNMIVHDLRTPLTSVITGMQTLEAMGNLDEIQMEMVGVSVAGGETLLGMINDLLDVEKMEAASMQLDYQDLDAVRLVAGAAAQVTSLLEIKRQALVSQIAVGLPAFRGDENKLRRVLVNLLGNAVKFTPAGGTLTLAARLLKNGRELLFSVGDTGEGIPAEAFERIFEKFGQVETRQSGRTMSTGLGLTFCKLAVEAHGGHIDVTSVPGEGSTFSFTVPVAEVILLANSPP